MDTQISLVWFASDAKNFLIPNDPKRILNIWNKLLIYYRWLTYVYQTIWNAYQNIWNAYNIHLKQTPYILQIVNLRLPNDLKCIPKHLKRTQYFPYIIVQILQILWIRLPDIGDRSKPETSETNSLMSVYKRVGIISALQLFRGNISQNLRV